MEYLLVVFAGFNEPEKYANSICDEMTDKFDAENLRYHFSDKSVILLFSCEKDELTLNKMLKEIFGKNGVIFVLLPYIEDSNSISMVHNMYPLFFDETKEKEITINFSVMESLNNESDLEFEIEEEPIFVKKPKKQKTLDELLEKINKVGYNGLTQNEKNLLDKYSENL